MSKTTPNSNSKRFVCINCGTHARILYKKFGSSMRTVNCDKCDKIVDEYVEFEPVITLVDAVLLSEKAFRHVLYNRDFKLHWKLSLVLLLLESFAQWRQKRLDIDFVPEQEFYICCLENIIDNLIYAILLFTSLLIVKRGRGKLTTHFISIVKAIVIANFSKFFILPIMVWRENTTEFGTSIHHLLVMGHHFLSLIFVYGVVSRLTKLQSTLIVLPLFIAKEYIKKNLFSYIESNI